MSFLGLPPTGEAAPDIHPDMCALEFCAFDIVGVGVARNVKFTLAKHAYHVRREEKA